MMAINTEFMSSRLNHSLSHTDPENGDLSSELLDGISAHARVCLRVARSGADDQLAWAQLGESFHCDFIVPEDRDGCTLEHQVLVDIPGK